MIPSNTLVAHPLSRVKKKHPARATPGILEVMSQWMNPGDLVLNPFSGTGRMAEIPGINPVLVEIEKDWATHVCGDATALPFADNTFDVVAFSPCLTPDQRVLTADLRWVPCGEIKVGDRLLAFDEYGLSLTAKGFPASRKYRIAEVEQSHRALKECVRVTLENGEVISCTTDHPWLASSYAGRSGLSRGGDRRPKKWTPANELLGKYVHKAFDVWQPRDSWDAGWLAGMFDGEGCLSFGDHGAPKLIITQNSGPIAESVIRRLKTFGFEVGVYPKGHDCLSIHVQGSFPGLLRCLGEMRPDRLIAKLQALDIASRTIKGTKKVKVVSVESIGMQEIQALTTSTRTYIGEGYLMHNTYGNRFADHHSAKDASTRRSYTHDIGHSLHPNNSGDKQWGPAYWDLHRKAYPEIIRTLKNHGTFILNIKDHYRGKMLIPVSEWHVGLLTMCGLTLMEQVQVPVPSMRMGKNHEARVEFEWVFVFDNFDYWGTAPIILS